MDALDRHAEVVKLARLLGCATGEVAFLDGADPVALRRFRAAVTSSLFDDDRDAFRRLASLGKLLPMPALIGITEKVLGPMLAGRVAGEMDAARVGQLAAALPTAFLAEVCQHMHPLRARAVVAAIAPDRIVEIALALEAAGDYVTMARFVDVLAPDVLERVIDATVDYGTLLRIGSFVEDKAQLDLVIGLFDDAGATRLIAAAHDGSLWSEAIAVMLHVGPATHRRLADLVAAHPPEVLAALVHAVHERALWPLLFQVLAGASSSVYPRIAALPVLADPDVQRAIIAAAESASAWHVVLPLLACMGGEPRQSALGLALDSGVPVLAIALRAAREHDLWPTLATIAGGLDDATLARIATSGSGVAAEDLREARDAAAAAGAGAAIDRLLQSAMQSA